MSEEAEAAKEIAKTTGKALEVVERVGSFLGRFVTPPLEQASAMVTDFLRVVRFERAVRLEQRVRDFMLERGLRGPSRSVPPTVALPLLQAGLLEDDDELQDVWANLLANAGDADSGVEVRRSFVSILRDLGSQEVAMLELIYRLPGGPGEPPIWTRELPARALLEEPKPEENRFPRPDVALGLGNLCRLGLLESAMTWNSGGTSLQAVYRTVLGVAFYEACTKRRPAEPRGCSS